MTFHAHHIDGHCHLSDEKIFYRSESVLTHSTQMGVSRWVLGGYEPEEWARQETLHRSHPHQIRMSFGMHPWWISANSSPEKSGVLEDAWVALETPTPHLHAIGETGLDHSKHVLKSSHSLQEKYFELHLSLAARLRLPLVLHILNSHARSIEILKSHPHVASGIIHSFSGTYGQAKQYLDLGYNLSINSGLLRKGFENLKETVVKAPLDRLSLETDCPDQAVGPEVILDIAQALANLRGITAEEVLKQSDQNLERLFWNHKRHL